jgi:predicted metal-dependent hydrolase
MSYKSYQLDTIGDVSVYKRRGTKRVNLKVSTDSVKITQPVWLPYSTGLQFALKNKDWIIDQKNKIPLFSLSNGQRIGKTYRISIVLSKNIRTRIADNVIYLYVPNINDLSEVLVKNRAKSAIKRALKIEASGILPDRLDTIAGQHSFRYNKLVLKSMKSRWGSCNNQKTITLNIFLMMLPWELIYYVIIHELVHTRHMHHGKDFWHEVKTILPDYKVKRAKLKNIQQSIYTLY